MLLSSVRMHGYTKYYVGILYAAACRCVHACSYDEMAKVEGVGDVPVSIIGQLAEDHVCVRANACVRGRVGVGVVRSVCVSFC